MSLVLPGREVVAGPTVGLKGQAVAVAEATAVAAAAAPVGCGGLPVYLRVGGENWRRRTKEEEEVVLSKVGVAGRGGFGLGGGLGGCMAVAGKETVKEAVSSDSSSIGEAESSISLSSSTGDGEEEEVQSKLKDDGLACLDSLEESLPIKRGLSNHFSGKSKSFANLSEAAVLGTAGGLAKAENPFNKRRRVLMACKASWQRRASYAALNATSNLWALEEEQEDHGGSGFTQWDGEDAGAAEFSTPSPTLLMGRKHIKASKAPRSFSLCDLRHA